MKRIVFYILSIIILLVILYGFIQGWRFLSDVILLITAFIVIWYTWETHKIRQYDQELLQKSKKPVINHSLYLNENNPLDTRFEIINNSDYPVAALVKCTFSIDNKTIKTIWPAYDGKEYWNLQYGEKKTGHFCWFDLYKQADFISKKNYKKLETLNFEDLRYEINIKIYFTYNLKRFPKLNLCLEIFTINDQKETLYYPPINYKLNLSKEVWIPKITSDIPYWDYVEVPSWAEEFINLDRL